MITELCRMKQFSVIGEGSLHYLNFKKVKICKRKRNSMYFILLSILEKLQEFKKQMSKSNSLIFQVGVGIGRHSEQRWEQEYSVRWVCCAVGVSAPVGCIYRE